MKTFNNYIQDKSINNKIIECATLMSDKDINPDVFLKTWYDANEPMVSLYLSEAGFWNGVQQGANTMWQGAKTASQQFGQGVKQGIQNFQRTAFGPKAQYQNAVKTLSGLVGYMQKTPQLSGYSNVTNQINKILNDLKNVEQQIPDYQNGQWKAQVDPMANRMNQGYAPPTQIPDANFNFIPKNPYNLNY